MNGEVSNEGDYRKALETCECCLQLFTSLIEQSPVSPSPGFVDKVMTGLPEGGISEINERPWHWPFLHYAAAACITFTLVHLGYFDYIYHIPEEMQLLEYSAEAGYHVQSVIDRLKSLLDFILVKGV